MASGGNVNFDGLIKFRDTLEENFSRGQVDMFIEACAKELAARLIAKVVKRTPVGQYPESTGKKGGTLRRGWTNGKGGGASAYANSLKVHKYGDAFVIEIENPVEYAPYVEYGHRTRGGGGWVEGHFMLTISESEIKRDAPKILEKKVKKKLGEVFK